MVELGITVKDKVTGFRGIVTGYVRYISGCNQALVMPPVDKDGKMRDSAWFDVQRLERIGKDLVVLENEQTPGFDVEPPKR